VPATADETLADEGRRRSQAGAVAIAAGVLTIGSGILAAVVYSGKPDVPLLEALREHLSANPPVPGLKVRQALFYDEHAVTIILVSVLLAAAAAAIGVALAHLFRSTKARRPELPRAAIVTAIAGAVLVAVGELTLAISVTVEAHAVANTAHPTAAQARDALMPPTALAAGLLRQLGVYALGFSFIIIALNAMRVGLLTRFMGVLGIIVGGLFIIPFGASLPIVQAVWLVALGALFLGFWPAGLPPAWVTGEAQPWPTQQELREQRLARQEESAASQPRRQRPEPPETPAPEAPVRTAHPSSKKRKRKRH
jgi:putative Mn2+ efflux pump MntP